ncbi:DUF4352 domain-containing protein [Nonomuraea sp. NPDC055795]
MTYQPYGQQPSSPGPPQHPHSGPNGYGYPPLPPLPKKSRAPIYALLFVVVLVIAVVGTVGVIAMNREIKEAAYEETTRNGKIGTAVRDGDLSFTVTKVERVGRIGSDLVGKDAQGAFLVVYVRVLNLGDATRTFVGSAQKLVDAGGREHAASTAAAMYITDSRSLYEKISPGKFVEGVVVFDIPKNVTPATVELHATGSSRGAIVQLVES